MYLQKKFLEGYRGLCFPLYSLEITVYIGIKRKKKKKKFETKPANCQT
jgi:hypothetical protein